MRPDPTYFIEVIKSHTGEPRMLFKNHIKLLQWSLSINKKFGIETIAVFKIYPKNAEQSAEN